MVLAPECDGPDGALDRIVVEFDTAVIEEAGEGGPGLFLGVFLQFDHRHVS
jgi:hypothetical protein